MAEAVSPEAAAAAAVAAAAAAIRTAGEEFHVAVPATALTVQVMVGGTEEEVK